MKIDRRISLHIVKQTVAGVTSKSDAHQSAQSVNKLFTTGYVQSELLETGGDEEGSGRRGDDGERRCGRETAMKEQKENIGEAVNARGRGEVNMSATEKDIKILLHSLLSVGVCM